MSFIMTIIVGFMAGVIAKFLMPGRNEASGFMMTTILGIFGAFAAQFLGSALRLSSAANGVGLIGAFIGSVIVLFARGVIQRRP